MGVAPDAHAVHQLVDEPLQARTLDPVSTQDHPDPRQLDVREEIGLVNRPSAAAAAARRPRRRGRAGPHHAGIIHAGLRAGHRLPAIDPDCTGACAAGGPWVPTTEHPTCHPRLTAAGRRWRERPTHATRSDGPKRRLEPLSELRVAPRIRWWKSNAPMRSGSHGAPSAPSTGRFPVRAPYELGGERLFIKPPASTLPLNLATGLNLA